MIKGIKATMLRPVVFLLTILFTAAPGAAWADNVPADRTILKIYTYANFAVIKFSPAFANNLGCGISSNADTHAARGASPKRAAPGQEILNQIGQRVVQIPGWRLLGGKLTIS